MTATLQDAAGYLARLGYRTPPPPTLEILRALQLRHTSAFAFETIDTLLRRPVAVDLPTLERKLLREGRGGYCFELNRLFLALLQHLGYEATALAGRVIEGDTPLARTHLLLLVTVEGEPYVVDAGFGGMVPTGPLRLRSQEAQATPHESFQLVDTADGHLLRTQVLGQWRDLYTFDLQRQLDVDLQMGSWYVSTHPVSPFIGQLRVACTEGPGVRKTLRDGSFAIHRMGAPSERHELADADAVLQVLREEFDLRLPPGPTLRDALALRLEATRADV